MFTHPKLRVYEKALTFGACAEKLSASWGRRHAISDHFLLNVAEGNGRYSELDHRRFLEIAATSAVKAAAFLDLYQQKAYPAQMETAQGRELLSRILAMLSRF